MRFLKNTEDSALRAGENVVQIKDNRKSISESRRLFNMSSFETLRGSTSDASDDKIHAENRSALHLERKADQIKDKKKPASESRGFIQYTFF